MKLARPYPCLLTLSFVAALHAQTPTITNVVAQPFNSNVLCPGDQVLVQGTNLGTTSTVVTVGTKNAFVKNANANGTTLTIQIPVDAPTGATTIKAGASAPFNITLSQFAPAILHDSNNIVFGFHAPSGTSISSTAPVSPGEQIGIQAFGLGPTTPPVATGQSASGFNFYTNTTPTATIASKPAVVQNAALVQGVNAQYIVFLTVPPDTPGGLQSVTISIGGFTSNTVQIPVSTAPVVSQVVNAGSYTAQGLPGSELAQGAIFVIKGILMGPSTIAIASNAFQVTNLAGTVVTVTSGSTSTTIPLYYTLDKQIAGLLPSNVPAGPATLTVSYNNQTSAPASFTIVPNQLGIFTASSDGAGAGIITYPDYTLVTPTKAANCGPPVTACGAANPGDVLTIWATGLGPITGTDTKGDGLGVDMPNLPLKVFVGGVQASQVLYRGRGCCVGEDQIAFVMPANTPTGCSIPLWVQIGGTLSNFTFMPVAASGRTCIPNSIPLGIPGAIDLLSSGTFNFADIQLRRYDNNPGYEDDLFANMAKVTIPPNLAPFAPTYLDQVPTGSCSVYTKDLSNDIFTTFSLLDAGKQLTIKGPNGTVTAGSTDSDQYGAVLSSNGTYLSPGTYTISAPGGKDIGAFSINYPIPTLPTLTTPAADVATTITRANGFTVNWSGGSAGTLVELRFESASDNTYSRSSSVNCFVDSTLHTFTVPANLLSTLAPTAFGDFTFLAHPPTIVNTTTSGVNLAIVESGFSAQVPVTYK